MNLQYLPAIQHKKDCFSSSNAHLFWHTDCKDMQHYTSLLVINHSKLQPAAQIAAKRRRLARILPQTVPRPRDSQIGCFGCIYLYLCSLRFCFVIVFVPSPLYFDAYFTWDVLFVCVYLYLCSLRFYFLWYLYFPVCILTHILLEMAPKSRDSQIGCCLLPGGPT